MKKLLIIIIVVVGSQTTANNPYDYQSVVSQQSHSSFRELISLGDNGKLSFWTSGNFNYTHLDYMIGDYQARYISNNCLSVSLGFDYGSYSLGFTVPLNASLMKSGNPVSSSFEILASFKLFNVYFDAKMSEMSGFYSVDGLRDFATGDATYRDDINVFTFNARGYYYFNDKFRYSRSLLFALDSKTSGHSYFLSSSIQQTSFNANKNLFNDEYPGISPHINYNLTHLWTLGSSINAGISYIYSKNNFLLMGIVGVGAILQLENKKSDETKWAMRVYPDLVFKMSVGYRFGGMLASLNIPINPYFFFLGDKTAFINNNIYADITIGINFEEVFKGKN